MPQWACGREAAGAKHRPVVISHQTSFYALAPILPVGECFREIPHYDDLGVATIDISGFPLPPNSTGSASRCYAEAMLEYLYGHGVSPREAWCRLGWSEAAQSGPFGRVARSSLDNLLSWSANEIGNRAIGLDFGRSVGGAGFGVLGLAAATASDLASAVQALIRLEPVTSTIGSAYTHLQGSEIEIGWKESAVPTNTSPIFAEAILASWVTFGRFLIGERVPIVRIEWTHAPTAPLSVYEEIFDAPIHFGAPSNSFTLSREVLSLRPRFAQPALHASLTKSFGGLSARAPMNYDSLVARALSEIQKRIDHAEICERAIAASLGVSLRSLQRHLAIGGFTFRDLLERARYGLSIRGLLGHRSSALAIAESVGFVEQSSFCRAFRRWTGISPGEFRRLFPAAYAQSRLFPVPESRAKSIGGT